MLALAGNSDEDDLEQRGTAHSALQQSACPGEHALRRDQVLAVQRVVVREFDDFVVHRGGQRRRQRARLRGHEGDEDDMTLVDVVAGRENCGSLLRLPHRPQQHQVPGPGNRTGS